MRKNVIFPPSVNPGGGTTHETFLGAKTQAHRCDTAAATWSAAIGKCHAAAPWLPLGGGQ